LALRLYDLWLSGRRKPPEDLSRGFLQSIETWEQEKTKAGEMIGGLGYAEEKPLSVTVELQ